jgi:hypothetical protein
MPQIAYTQQVPNCDEREQSISTDLNVVPQIDIKAVEISFYDHEIYASDKLIAKITHDADDFVTQRWVVTINEVEVYRANTWAKSYNYITWHYNQGTLPTQQQEVETVATGNSIMVQNQSLAKSWD